MRVALKLGVVLLVLLALVQLVLWYSASRWFAGLARHLEPVASLDYGSSYAWLNGRAGIRDVQLRPRLGVSEQAAAERIELSAGDPLTLIQLLWSGVETWPERMDLRVQRLRLAAGLERDLRERTARLGYLLPFEALGCNGRGRFVGSDYAELGWLQAHTDLELSVRSDRLRNTVQLQLVYDQDPLARFEVDVELSALAGRGLAGAAMSSPNLQRLRLGYEDRGMLDQRNAYCARRLSMTERAFLDRHLEAVTAEMEARGIFLDPSVYRIYRDFAQHGGKLEFRAAPSAPVAMANFGGHRLDQRLKMLNSSLSHNMGPLVPVTARFFTEGAGADSAAAAAESVRIRASAEDADLVELEELDDLVGHRILIRMRDGRGHVGVLLGTQGPLIRLQVETAGRSQVSVVSSDQVAEIRLAH